MQRTLVIVSAMALAAAGTTFAACSSDDNGTGPGLDSGAGDTSTPIEDSYVPPQDSNVPLQDSTVPPEDSGVPPEDSSTGEKDSGSDAKSTVDAGEGDASDASSATDSSDAQTASDAGTEGDANDAAAPVDASEADASDAGGDAGVTLNVLNFLNWCTVTINGNPPKTGTTVTASVPADSIATIVAIPRPNLADGGSGFIIGPDPWFGTNENDGGAAPGVDQGSGATESTTAAVTVGTGPIQCVSVCCALANNGTPACPTANPCPL